ncbi:hypothetical protein KR084_012646 [Drosophila pseudotakahashii]|nr:hypothetical protein KR084_012646 [Drosophila pseudotakahashii]
MNHCRRSEQQKRNGAGRESQTELSQDSHTELCPKPRPVTQKSCPGSQNAPENMYVLKNCDRCQDYTVQPCNNGCKCPKRGTQCDGQCDISDREKSQVQSQQSFPEAVTPRTKMTQPSKTSLDPASYRRMGGNCPICQLCGQAEIRHPDQSMCPNCNEKIQSAVDNYYVQCQGQCQQGTGQPCPYRQDQVQSKAQGQQPPPGHWQQLNGSPYDAQQQQQQLGEQPFNIIVLQDCNNHALIDQLTTAINRGGGQMHTPIQNNTYRNSYSNQPHNYQNNPLSGYLDYEYLDLNRKGYGYEHEREDRYNDGYDMGLWPMDPYYGRDGYEDERYPHSSSCNSYDCPAKNDLYPKEDPWRSDQNYEENLSPMDNGQSNCSNCNCCKGGDIKDKLALLIAQALEIFISSNQCKQERDKDQDQNLKQGKVKQSEQLDKKQKKRGRRSRSSDRKTINAKVENLLGTSKSSKARLSALATPVSQKRPPNDLLGTAKSSRAKLSAVPSLFSKTNSLYSTNSKVAKRSVNPISKDSSMFSSVDVANVGSRYKEVSNRNEKPPFFLPNCEEHRCKNDCQGICSRKPHDCDKGCKSICRGPCSKSGGGDGRSRSKASGKKNRPQQRHARCQQCNQGEGRQWQEVGGTTDCPDGTNTGAVSGALGCAGCGGGKDRNAGGGKNTLLGLSPIAHYRPGMLKFPVNYLLAGTNCRRSLVRTAAGVTLHQKPYVNMAEAKDLPEFPCRKKSSSTDCRTPAKKWL